MLRTVSELVIMCLLLLLLCVEVQKSFSAPIAKTVAPVILPKSAWKEVFFFLISFFPLQVVVSVISE